MVKLDGTKKHGPCRRAKVVEVGGAILAWGKSHESLTHSLTQDTWREGSRIRQEQTDWRVVSTHAG